MHVRVNRVEAEDQMDIAEMLREGGGEEIEGKIDGEKWMELRKEKWMSTVGNELLDKKVCMS